MNVKLRIEEDAELRTVIRNAILGEVKGIVREELRGMVLEEVQRKVSEEARLFSPVLITQKLEKVVAKVVCDLYPEGTFTKKDLDPRIAHHVDKIFAGADFKKLVQAGVIEKLKRVAAED